MKRLLVLLLIIIFSSKATPQTWIPQGTWAKGAFPGQTRVIKFVNDFMIFDAGRSIRLYNVKNIDSPYELDSKYIAPVEDIHIFNSYIIVKLIYTNIIKIFKISEGNKLTYIKDFEFDRDIISTNIINNKMFLLSPNQILIYSIGNNFNIALDTTIISSNNQYSKVVGTNDYFIMSKGSKIFIYRQNSDNSYSFVRSFTTGTGSIVDMKIKGDKLLLSGYHIGLRIIDISQLTQPIVLSNYYLEKTGLISFSNVAAFIHDYNFEGIKIFDISNPTLPTLKSEYHVGHSYTGGNYYYRNRLFLCNYYVSRIYQLKIVNKFQVNYFQDIIAENNQYIFSKVLIHNNTAILKTNFGVTFANAKNYKELEVYSEINDIGEVSNIELYLNHLIVSADDKLLIYDIDNPADIKLLSTFTHNETIKSFIIKDNYIFLYSSNYFKIFSIHGNSIVEKYSRSPSCNCPNPSYVKMRKLGNQIHLYIIWRDEYIDYEMPDKVEVVNIQDPNNATLIGIIDGNNYGYKLYENKGIIYGLKIPLFFIDDWSNKLYVCDISNLDSIHSVYQTSLSDIVDNLYFDDNFAYVYRYNKIMTISLSNPINPTQVNSEIVDFVISDGINKNENTFYFFGAKNWRSSVGIYKNNLTSVSQNSTLQLPAKFNLNAYPNPFNPTTTIIYSIPQKTHVQIIVYDALGKEIATLVNKEQTSGNHKVVFNASQLASGVYFYTLHSSNLLKTKKLVLIK